MDEWDKFYGNSDLGCELNVCKERVYVWGGGGLVKRRLFLVCE